jgi:hypothetical protein
MKSIRLIFSTALAIIAFRLVAHGEPLHSGLPLGSYTGAGQIMEFNTDGKPIYGDNLGICHIELKPNEHLVADFPITTKTNSAQFKAVFLDLKTVQPRATWSAAYKDGTVYKVTAIPFSTHQFVFRLEAFRKLKLVAGAQQFYSFCDVKEPN